MPHIRTDSTATPTVERKPKGATLERRNSSVDGKVFKVEDGDTLCGIARAAGYPTCNALRKSPINKDLAKKNWQIVKGDRVFVPLSGRGWQDKAQTIVRFTRGGESPGVAVSALFVSNFPPDKCGENQDIEFPTDPVTGYDANLYADEDTFKVEIVDPLLPRDVKQFEVTLEALEPVYRTGGILDGHKSFDSPKARTSPRLLTTIVRRKDDDILRSGYLRLVTANTDRVIRPETSLLVGTLSRGPGIDPNVEILDQDVRATYTIPTCDASSHKCSVSTQIGLDRGISIGVGVRFLRPDPNGIVIDRLDPGYTATTEKEALSFNTFLKNLHGQVREVFAQAQVRFRLRRMERVDPPSDMLAIGDWDGKRLTVPRLHAAENGKKTAKNANSIQFKLRWWQPGIGDQDVKVGPLKVPSGSTPEETANVLVKAIQIALPDANPQISVNPQQTNATGESCDVVFMPKTGRITITALSGADTAQPIHIIHIDLNEQLVLSNFPESYHIGSPQMRCMVKSFQWASDETIKVIVAAYPGKEFDGPSFAVASGGDAVAMGLGALRDFTDHPLPIMSNTVMVSQDLTKKQYYLAHEFGHVLIDTGAHALVDTELMVQVPQDKIGNKLCGKLPKAPNWEYFPLASDGRTRDFVKGATHYAKIAINAVERIRNPKSTLGTGTPVLPPTPVAFTPLKSTTRSALQSKMQELVNKLVGMKTTTTPAVTIPPITPNGNYISVRGAKLYAWDKYRQAFDQNTPHPDHLATINGALEEAKQLGSTNIQKYIANAKPAEPKVQFAKLLLDSTDDEFWDGFVTQCPSALTLIMSDTPLAGFRGLNVDILAMFINLEDYGQPGQVEPTGQVTQPGATIKRHCYTVMHELLHLCSFEAKGFQAASAPSGATGQWQEMLDEGATELFTRLLLYRSDNDSAFKTMDEHPEIMFFGLDERYLPVYEVPKNIVAQMAKDVGIYVLAKAYFLGEFTTFFNALDAFEEGGTGARRYTTQFWENLSNMAITARPYLDSKSPETVCLNQIRDIRTRGLDESADPTLLLDPTAVIEAWKDGSYVDPAKQFLDKVP